jgi:hypothetical protein
MRKETQINEKKKRKKKGNSKTKWIAATKN